MRTRWPAAAAAVVLGLGWTLVAPAGAARAASAPPPPVNQLSSALAAQVGTASTDAAVSGLTATGGSAVLAGSASVGSVSVATVGGYAGAGLLIGFAGAGAVMQVAGLTSTGSFGCDVKWAFNASTSCAHAGPATTYVVNSDASAFQPGFVGGSNLLTATTMGGGAGGFTNVIGTMPVALAVSGPASGTAGTVSVSVAATRAFSSSAGESGYVKYGYALAVYGQSGWPTGTSGPVYYSGFGYRDIHLAPYQFTANVSAGSRYAVVSYGGGGTDLVWYPVGDANRPAEPGSNPSRTFVTSWLCSTGGAQSAASAPFHEADPEWPGIPNAVCDGSALTHVTVSEVTTGLPTRVLWTWDAPPAVTAANAAHPQCVGGGCQLLLERVDAVTGARLNCFSSSSVCQDWWTHTTGATTNTSDYACTYGGDAVALSECTVYAHAFDPQTPTYADPRNGNAPTPASGGEPNPGPQDNSCPPPFSWTALFNNWWAFKATSCALSWAFVPSDQFWTDQQSQLQSGLGTRAPFSVIAVLPGTVTGLADGWGSPCTQLPNFSAIPDKPLRLPCSPPDSAGWQTAYVLMSVLLWVSVVMGLWRMAHNAVGGNE